MIESLPGSTFIKYGEISDLQLVVKTTANTKLAVKDVRFQVSNMRNPLPAFTQEIRDKIEKLLQ